MAEVKITGLPAATAVTSDDLVPIVDGGTTTQKATFQQVLNYITGSTFNDFTVTSLTASVTGTFAGDGTGITGVTAEWDGSHVGDGQITGSFYVTETVSGSSVEATNITGSVVSASNFYGDGTGITGVTAEWDGSHTGDASITGSLFVSGGTLQTYGDTILGDSIADDLHQVSGSLQVKFQGTGGNTPADRAFRVQNSSGVDTYVVYDNGLIYARGGTSTLYASFGTAGTAYLVADNAGCYTVGRVRVANAVIQDTARFTRHNDTTTGMGFPFPEAVSMVLGGTDVLTVSTGSGTDNLLEMEGNADISGSLIANVALSGAVGSEITSTSYTLSTDDRGKTLLFSSSAIQGITCSSGIDVGYNSTFIQMGSGQLELSASGGVSLLNRQSHTKSAGLYAAVSVVIVSADTYILAGDTSA